jgi:hypothetical protein
LTEAATEMKQVLSDGLLEPKAKLWFRQYTNFYDYFHVLIIYSIYLSLKYMYEESTVSDQIDGHTIICIDILQ